MSWAAPYLSHFLSFCPLPYILFFGCGPVPSVLLVSGTRITHHNSRYLWNKKYCSPNISSQIFLPIHHICHFCSTDKIFGLIFAPHKSAQIATKWILRQNSVNQDKTAYIVNLSYGAKFGTRKNLSLIHIHNFSTWQTILSCGARLLVMWSNFVPHDHQHFYVEQNDNHKGQNFEDLVFKPLLLYCRKSQIVPFFLMSTYSI